MGLKLEWTEVSTGDCSRTTNEVWWEDDGSEDSVRIAPVAAARRAAAAAAAAGDQYSVPSLQWWPLCARQCSARKYLPSRERAREGQPAASTFFEQQFQVRGAPRWRRERTASKGRAAPVDNVSQLEELRPQRLQPETAEANSERRRAMWLYSLWSPMGGARQCSSTYNRYSDNQGAPKIRAKNSQVLLSIQFSARSDVYLISHA